MRSESFLDTNVLIYAAAGRTSEPRKHAIALRLIADVDFGVSAQTLGEFFVAVARKAALAMPLEDIDEWIDQLARRPFTDVDLGIVRGGIYFARQYRIAYYDATLLAAAERLGAVTFYTEDLKHDELYGSVRAINPFLEH